MGELFAEDQKNYPLLPGFPYTTKGNAVRYQLKEKKAQQPPTQEGMLIQDWPGTYVLPSADGVVSFYVKVNEVSKNNATQKFPVLLVDTITGKDVATKTITLDKNWQLVSLKGTPGKIYKLIRQNTGWIRLAVPEGQWMAFKTIPTYSVLGRLWFYASPQESFLYFTNNSKEHPVFSDAKGRKVAAEKVNEANLFRVNTSQSANQWWTIEASEYKLLQFHGRNILFFPHNNIVATNQALSSN
jgi:hypothetical protein